MINTYICNNNIFECALFGRLAKISLILQYTVCIILSLFAPACFPCTSYCCIIPKISVTSIDLCMCLDQFVMLCEHCC